MCAAKVANSGPEELMETSEDVTFVFHLSHKKAKCPEAIYLSLYNRRRMKGCVTEASTVVLETPLHS